MAYAKCSKCGHTVHYKAIRGSRIKDMICEKCDHMGLVKASMDEWLGYRHENYPGPHYYDPRIGFGLSQASKELRKG